MSRKFCDALGSTIRSPARRNRLRNEHNQSKAAEPSFRQNGTSCLSPFILLVVGDEGNTDSIAWSGVRGHVQLPFYFFSGPRTIMSIKRHQRCHHQAQAKLAQQFVG